MCKAKESINNDNLQSMKNRVKALLNVGNAGISMKENTLIVIFELNVISRKELDYD